MLRLLFLTGRVAQQQADTARFFPAHDAAASSPPSGRLRWKAFRPRAAVGSGNPFIEAGSNSAAAAGGGSRPPKAICARYAGGLHICSTDGLLCRRSPPANQAVNWKPHACLGTGRGLTGRRLCDVIPGYRAGGVGAVWGCSGVSGDDGGRVVLFYRVHASSGDLLGVCSVEWHFGTSRVVIPQRLRSAVYLLLSAGK